MKKQKNIRYKKINSRKLRHEFSALRDSISAGQAYELTYRGSPLAYVIPAAYEVEVKSKKERGDKKLFMNAVNGLRGTLKKDANRDDLYRKRLARKHK